MIVGIDISKLKFDVTFLFDNGKERHKTFTNNPDGFKNLKTWFHDLKAKDIHVCLEATGSYSEKVSLFLHQEKYKVSVINPTRIKAYARSEGLRTKTDKIDSGVIARFCKSHCPPAWMPPSCEERHLKDLYRYLQNLLEDKTRLSNRLENLDKKKASCKIWNELLESVEKKIKDVENQIETLLVADKTLKFQVDLLKTIPGVSQKTAVAILAELPNVQDFETAKQMAAFAGLTPCIRQSGTSLRGKGTLSKVGNAQVRKALYMPAIVAKRHNPMVSEFCKRLTQKGKATMVVIAAAMRKLLHIIFGVLKNQKSFTFLPQQT